VEEEVPLDEVLAKVDMEDKLADELRGTAFKLGFGFRFTPGLAVDPVLEFEVVPMPDRTFQVLWVEEELVDGRGSVSGDLARVCDCDWVEVGDVAGAGAGAGCVDQYCVARLGLDGFECSC
jgi:hypothetical protein